MASDRLEIRLTKAEKSALRKAAAERGKPLSEYAREALFRTVFFEKVEAKIETGTAILREQIAALSTVQTASPTAVFDDASLQKTVRESAAAVLETLLVFTQDQAQKQRIRATATDLLQGRSPTLSTLKP
jgi:rRNA-processing protein FCF1